VNNNYYRFSLNVNDKDIILPVELSFDNEGREMGVEEYQNSILNDIINGVDDFETTKFGHAPWDTNQDKTEIHYQFNFFSPTTNTDFFTVPPSSNDWLDDYQYATFTDSEIYFFANSFKGSFFKLDFYDTKVSETQKILFSIVIPTQQGIKEPGFIGPPLNPTSVDVKKPKFILDYVGADKEGFFIYWLKNTGYLNVSTFYMSAKFFNAKKGQFIRMMNVPQSFLVGPNVYNFDKSEYFYYRVDLDYSNYEYKVYRENPSPVRVGVGSTTNEAIIWYEYVNP
jgi:hypothetical protein